MKRVAMVGQKYGRLLVEAEEGAYARALCDCGITGVYKRSNLLAGYTQSCGCLRNERIRATNSKHGLRQTRTYRIWCAMKSRCDDPTRANYRYYGGRGITYCARWQDFAAFYTDMGECPEGKELDRIDNNGDYTPENCRWVTHAENMQNRG